MVSARSRPAFTSWVSESISACASETGSAVDPERAGLPADGRVRRVPGLRREEVAMLAGVSTDYYTRLEQGRRITPSDAVLDGIARALDLDATGPGLYQLLDSLDGAPAMILGRRTDVLATNRAARVLFADFNAMPPRERNYARWMFTSQQARNLFADWEVQARSAVENLRLDVGADLTDPTAAELVAELSQASAQFRAWWSEHRVFQRTYGTKRLRHPVVGELTVDYETFTMPGDADQALFVYTTEAASPSRDALNLLLSWSATPSVGAG
ncbi:XRE family transcriptional regulator [Mycolicibacterium vaccae ATCC 25954]|uniref:XRE family transcriptional regulator n=1 Tax=Mycolicibacterium vaccae ATCC 25954 TaxID=1194972 RepID=K0UVW9_MYCVA|nr:XRE family transcriptional regulator [Mycolicibacterium vaccae 95051]EJZ06763.1 XRE family transcriptional regulator [Mycolicibacterium vaccae ATCC 25954]